MTRYGKCFKSLAMNVAHNMSLKRLLFLAILVLLIPSLVQLSQTVMNDNKVIDATELQLAGVY